MPRQSTTPALGRAALGGARVAPVGARSGGISVPGFSAAFYWTVGPTQPAIGQAALGGRTARIFPSAGLSAAPDQADGTITVPLYWAFADRVTLTRINPTGERTPVRASPVDLDGPSRRNLSTNPKAKASLSGYSAGTNTALSRLTGQDTPHEQVTTAVRATTSTSGSAAIQLTLDAASPASTSYGLLARTSETAASIVMQVVWYSPAGTTMVTETYPMPAATLTGAASDWTPGATVADGPPGSATGTITWIATGLSSGATFDITARITEAGGDGTGAYFDGDFQAASWVGTPGLSFSDLAMLTVVVDTEAPFDTPVRYELTNSAYPAFAALSDPVTLSSDSLFYSKRQCLISHPGLARTIPVWIEDAPTISNELEQTAIRLPGRRRKVVVSAAERNGDEGELTFVCETFDERDRLRELLDDGSPLLLRMPASFGYPSAWWLKFGNVSTEPNMRRATHQVRRLKAPFIEVDRPSVATRPLEV